MNDPVVQTNTIGQRKLLLRALFLPQAPAAPSSSARFRKSLFKRPDHPAILAVGHYPRHWSLMTLSHTKARSESGFHMVYKQLNGSCYSLCVSETLRDTRWSVTGCEVCRQEASKLERCKSYANKLHSMNDCEASVCKQSETEPHPMLSDII